MAAQNFPNVTVDNQCYPYIDWRQRGNILVL